MTGTLYIVATPIGNLADISERALQVLRGVDLIAVEDTRHSGALLRHFGIGTPMQAYHDFNERALADQLLARIGRGEDIALISDAGTPLVSDPGYHLVRLAHEAGIRVVPVPGASACIAALSGAGLPTDRFTFEGFLPAKGAARTSALEALSRETRTMIFYEAPHRILASLRDMLACFGPEREVTLVRELTKTFETILHGTLMDMVQKVEHDSNQQLGEIVLLVAGYKPKGNELDDAAVRTLRILLDELPLNKAAAVAARITGLKKSLLYDAGLQLQGKKPGASQERL